MSHIEGIVDVVFPEGPLYIKVNKGQESEIGMQYVPTIVKFLSTDSEEKSPVRASGAVSIGDVILQVGDTKIVNQTSIKVSLFGLNCLITEFNILIRFSFRSELSVKRRS